MQKENSFFFFISALGDVGDAFRAKRRKNESKFSGAKDAKKLCINRIKL